MHVDSIQFSISLIFILGLFVFFHRFHMHIGNHWKLISRYLWNNNYFFLNNHLNSSPLFFLSPGAQPGFWNGGVRIWVAAAKGVRFVTGLSLVCHFEEKIWKTYMLHKNHQFSELQTTVFDSALFERKTYCKLKCTIIIGCWINYQLLKCNLNEI